MKQYLITTEKTEISIKVQKHHWAKKMTMKITKYGTVSVTIPKYSTYKIADRFIENNKDWILKSHKKVHKNITKKGSSQQIEKARNLVYSKLEHWNKIMKVKWNKIFIRNQTTRWGSCSGKNNLSFNWRIINLPAELQDYLIIHELAHIKQHNHSAAFWREVEDVLPNYKILRKRLGSIDLVD